MSRLGKKPLTIPAGVTVKVDAASRKVEVKGPKGTLNWMYPKGIAFKQENPQLWNVKPEEGVSPVEASPAWGLTRSRVNWMLEGVVSGFIRQLEIQGVGYRAKVEGAKLVLNIGNSYPVDYSIPTGITITVDQKQTGVTIAGADKELVGLVTSQIRSLKPPEPYKGKGIRYLNEVVTRKAGKTAATGAGKAGK